MVYSVNQKMNTTEESLNESIDDNTHMKGIKCQIDDSWKASDFVSVLCGYAIKSLKSKKAYHLYIRN